MYAEGDPNIDTRPRQPQERKRNYAVSFVRKCELCMTLFLVTVVGKYVSLVFDLFHAALLSPNLAHLMQ